MSLDLRDVSFSIGGKVILRDVAITFQRGEVTAIVGPNGAGKSTLLHLASGVIAPSAGEILLDGTPLGRLHTRELAERRAMLPQDIAMGARFRLRDLVAMGASVSAAQLAGSARAELVDAQLRRLGLDHLAERDVTSLSGGERQRAHLARVLMQLEAPVGAASNREDERPPGFLLLDEPLSAQDPAHQGLVLGVAREHARRGGGVVLVLHDLNWAAACADRLYVMHRGALHAHGLPADILTEELVRSVFGLTNGRIRWHEATGKPYLLPHDIISQGENPCISQ